MKDALTCTKIASQAQTVEKTELNGAFEAIYIKKEGRRMSSNPQVEGRQLLYLYRSPYCEVRI